MALSLSSPRDVQLARDARYHHAATVEEEGRADVVILASRLASIGLAVTLRTAVGELPPLLPIPGLLSNCYLHLSSSHGRAWCFWVSWAMRFLKLQLHKRSDATCRMLSP